MIINNNLPNAKSVVKFIIKTIMSVVILIFEVLGAIWVEKKWSRITHYLVFITHHSSLIFIWYAFCCRTPINIVSSFNGWTIKHVLVATIKHVLVAVKQLQLCGKGSQVWQLRLRP